MNQELKNRVKSFIWRLGGMTFVVVGAYVLQVGDIFKLDPKTMINLAAITVIGLAVGEITKWLNPGK